MKRNHSNDASKKIKNCFQWQYKIQKKKENDKKM